MYRYRVIELMDEREIERKGKNDTLTLTLLVQLLTQYRLSCIYTLDTC